MFLYLRKLGIPEISKGILIIKELFNLLTRNNNTFRNTLNLLIGIQTLSL